MIDTFRKTTPYVYQKFDPKIPFDTSTSHSVIVKVNDLIRQSCFPRVTILKLQCLKDMR